MSNVSMIKKFIAQIGESKTEQNITIRGNVLLSYQTPIVKIIGDTLVMSTFNYSATTNRHYSIVISTVISTNQNKYDVIRVPNINISGSANLEALQHKKDDLMLKQAKARLNASNYDAHLLEVNKAIDFVCAFKPLFPLV